MTRFSNSRVNSTQIFRGPENSESLTGTLFAIVLANESQSQLKLKEVCCDLVSIAFKTGRSLIEIWSQLHLAFLVLRLSLNYFGTPFAWLIYAGSYEPVHLCRLEYAMR